MNQILKKSGSAIFRLLVRCKPGVRPPQPPLRTATRSYRAYRRRLPAVSRSATTPSHGLLSEGPRRPELIHFTRGRGGEAWYHDWRKVAARVLAPGAAAIAAYYHNLETVPYTNRTHLVFLSPRVERWLGGRAFDDLKKEKAGMILPAEHYESVRVRRITSEIVWAARCTLGVAPVDPAGELLNDRFMARNYGKQAMTRHLDGLDWEVIVVEDRKVNAMCVPGKIVVYTGLLDYFKTDAEIASVLGHEVGHIIARHSAEAITKSLCSYAVQRLVMGRDSPDFMRGVSKLLFTLPFSRKMEIEADHIGMLLLAAAGFDPHIAIAVEEKLGKISRNSELENYLSTHPSGKKRVQSLSQDKVLKEAMELYREANPVKEAERFSIPDPFDIRGRRSQGWKW
ncbi:mitochondrial metalloendopeptidase OMA1-like [Triticum dicoccoides]|uniref:mitochondrial metalloendopeptidase OMA1-like n=1 Tax=Triticum dicoccoides TaxID=85692 RepID=UPI00162C2C76|nr:mitochondrial metalloendopeptidase OMA1-like [Triticum dicoccoides]XP_044409685.1 mitochondrial metalloendopeptidase OMA1-like [Triticum aestivum]